jgi:outer membrane protein OmpA-like peptidoglycan-associated protein
MSLRHKLAAPLVAVSVPAVMLSTVMLSAGALAPLLLMPIAAHAQGNPSADSIINSLKPGPNLGSGTRGLRAGGPSPSSAAPAPVVEPSQSAGQSAGHAAAPHAAPRQVASARPAPAEKPSVNLTVEFATGSADLTPAAIHTLDELGKALSSNELSSYHFRIEGHTDTVGTRDANKGLSERRADAVVEYLSSHFNVDRARLQPVGMGEDGLLVSTGDQVPEARNRRVLVVNLGA